jgi:hypothetical protein
MTQQRGTHDRRPNCHLALPDLAHAIDREHEAVISAANSALDHAVRCGELLIQAKRGMAHGEWLGWLEANCTVRPRMAQAYMRLARELPKLPEANTQRVAHLTVRDALRTVAQNAAWIAALPESEQDDFIDLAESTDALVQARHQHQRARNLVESQLSYLAALQAPAARDQSEPAQAAHEKRRAEMLAARGRTELRRPASRRASQRTA